jgi:hypothetical protein
MNTTSESKTIKETKPKKILISTRWGVDDIGGTEYMLTIKNFRKKLIGKTPIDKKWFVSSVDETPTQYHIHITLSNGTPLNRINIERTPMKSDGYSQYELWWWLNDPDPAHQPPVRKMLSASDLRIGSAALLELIDYMLKLK